MLLQDLRFALRSFLRAPRFTVPALVALALGIGATSAIFSIVRGVILKPLPYRDPERIVAIWEHRVDRNRPRNVIASANFVAWRERNTSFELLGMVTPLTQNIVLNGQPEEVSGFFASSDALAAFGTQPQLGRLYTPDEDLASAERVVVVTHEFWQARLGGRSDVLGMQLTMNQQPRTVIGVMPPGFTIEGLPGAFMVPYGWTVEQLRNSPGRGSSHGIARLRDGVSFEQAYSEMRTIMSQLEKEMPQRNTNWSITLVPIHEQTVDQIRPALYVLGGAVLLVLVDRLRQRRQPAAREEHRAATRAGAAHGARRRARAIAAPDADGKRVAVSCRRHCRARCWPSCSIAACLRSWPIAFRCRGSIKWRSMRRWCSSRWCCHS